MPIRRSLPLVATAALAAVALSPARAGASSADVASTKTYIQANYALVQAARSHLTAAEHAPRRVLAQVRRECPMAAAESPQNADSTQMSNEVIGAMVLTAYHLDRPAGKGFVRAVSRLHLGDRRLANAVRGYANQLGTLLKLPVPNLCADVRAWVASAYETLPASTASFDRRFMPAWVAIGLLPGRLSAYERPEEQGVLARTRAIEVQITDAEARAVETWGEIMNELGLSP
jgi:hypothetical protein